MSGTRVRWWVSGCLISACLMLPGLAPGLSGEGNPPPERIAPPKRIPPEVAPVSQPQGTPVSIATLPREVRRAVVADAARRFAVAESAVVLSDAEQVTWGDGSLGCPQLGMAYTQALVPGYRVSATTAAGRMRYHTDVHGRVATCEPTAPAGARDAG